MNILYLDCSMGVAGDMLTAALLDLFPDGENILKELNDLKIPVVTFSLDRARKCGIEGAHVRVDIKGKTEEELLRGGIDKGAHEEQDHHIHHGLERIEEVVRSLSLPEKVEKDILSVYGILASAESKVHGVPVHEIHFHEVGDLDAIADITAVCFLINRLSPDRIICGNINLGSGTVRCAHGVLPVPAPATAEIVKGLPVYDDGIKGELTTPTGAALIKHFTEDYRSLPVMKIRSVGYGMGNKDFERANCVRAIFGESNESGAPRDGDEGLTDTVAELSCNIDDMTGEEMGFASEMLREAGALDVWTSPIYMKKGRPGVCLNLLCPENEKDRFAEMIFKLTSTLGIRETLHHRILLKRENRSTDTSFGDVRVKEASGYGVTKEKYEYEDVAKIAREKNISLRDAKELIRQHTS